MIELRKLENIYNRIDFINFQIKVFSFGNEINKTKIYRALKDLKELIDIEERKRNEKNKLLV